MANKIFGLAILLFLTTEACEINTTGENAIVSDAEMVSEIPDNALVFELDTSVSTVTWTGSKPTGQHHGTIAITSGKLAIADDSIIGGEIIMDLNVIDNTDLRDDPIDYNRLINHLKSRDFFDVENHPISSFIILEVTPYDAAEEDAAKKEFPPPNVPKSKNEHRVENPTHWIKGNLTLRGSTYAIKFPSVVRISDQEIEAEAKFNIDRTQWGLMYKNEGDIRDKAKDSFIYNTVNTGFIIKARTTPTS